MRVKGGFIIVLAALLALSSSMLRAQESSKLSDSKLIAQKAAIKDLSGDDPFVLRQTWWKGTIKPGQAKLIQIQLFKRNDYRFWYAVPARDAKISLHLYNGKGDLIKTVPVDKSNDNITSSMLSVDATGTYYVRIFLSKAIKAPQEWALIYGYR